MLNKQYDLVQTDAHTRSANASSSSERWRSLINRRARPSAPGAGARVPVGAADAGLGAALASPAPGFRLRPLNFSRLLL
ncbi:hypothetical protein EVAR_69773_1 [Eumeta japonica]|uniref:Uncharacterized protein n=1 Tax=Eumeta variegata TaxID=151549 RepID=A0A4C2A737_EUMVA|nr:hypothetical protein EVAR_69773_1 [Eumeta japonica]